MRIIPVAIGIKEYMFNSGTPTNRKIPAKKIQLVIVEKKTKSKIPFVYLPSMYLSTKLDEAQNSGASNERKIQFIYFLVDKYQKPPPHMDVHFLPSQ